MTRGARVRTIVVGPTRASRDGLLRTLALDSEFEIVGDHTADSTAASAIQAKRPEIVVLDGSDLGAATAAVDAIMSRAPTPILVVVEEPSLESARRVFLPLGVVEVVALESGSRSSELVRTARLVARIRVVTRRRPRDHARTATSPSFFRARAPERGIVAIGASTGGPAVVAEILRGLPARFPVPVVIVVHIGPNFGYSFADWLGGSSTNPVHQASDGMKLLPGHVYVGPPERHLVVEGETLQLSLAPERHSCRPSVDVLFESVAGSYGHRAVGCLLTGIGRDGAEGLLAMRTAGAYTIAQDEASSAVYGMPREAVALDAVDTVANPVRIVSLLTARASALAVPRSDEESSASN